MIETQELCNGEVDDDDNRKELRDDSSKISRVRRWVEQNFKYEGEDNNYEGVSSCSTVCKPEDSNIDIDDPLSTADEQTEASHSQYQPRLKLHRYKNDVLHMKCEWDSCEFVSTEASKYVDHVSQHLPVSEPVDKDGEQVIVYMCLWDSCGFDSEYRDEILRHINYHAYHTRIKMIGTTIMKKEQLPECTLDYEGRNLLPVLPSEFRCEWDDCKTTFINISTFFDHVLSHLLILPRGKQYKDLKCEWFHCNKTFQNYTKVKDHIKVHTHEKLVGCPTCGMLFASKTKFGEHCLRQVPTERRMFKCSFCSKYYTTETFLKEHIKLHINIYKCPACDLTFSNSNSVALHIRYKHINFKPFKCKQCEYSAVSERDLEKHQLVHCSENFWFCEFKDCDFSCRSKHTLQRHIQSIHEPDSEEPVYECHLCSRQYTLGMTLTKHLRKFHSISLAADQMKFKYLKHEDGIWRLQTFRYETIDLAKDNAKRFKFDEKKYEAKENGFGKFIIQEADENKKVEVEEKEVERSESESSVETDNERKRVVEEIERSLLENYNITTDDGSSDESCFGEQLKAYLGLTSNQGFIKVVKK